jgi:hypothetical protein
MTSVANFIAELLNRFFSQKPKFFTIVQVIAAIFAAANVALTQLVSSGLISSTNSIVNALSSGIALAISVTTAIVAQLPKKDANAVASGTTPPAAPKS